MTSPSKPVLIIVRDGWGVRPEREGNAVALARTPRHDEYWARFPTALVNASEHHVGLPAGQMGNSEVGHLNMGAGRVVYQDFARIQQAAQAGALADNPVIVQAMERAEERDRALHLMGLVSDGGVHSHMDHVKPLLELAKQIGVAEVYVHAITDGRDTDPQSGRGYLETVVGWTRELGVGQVATVAGRYYTMDRDKRWDRVQLGYDAMVHGKGPTSQDPLEVLTRSYADGKGDEFVIPTVITDHAGRALGPMRRGDQVIAFNFRADRMRQICAALCDPAFDGFDRPDSHVLELVSMTEYQEGLPTLGVAFAPQTVRNHISELIGNLGRSQFKAAETEKYAHVTFFWNGGVEAPCPREDRLLIPSPKVATYDLQPEMSARAVADGVVERIRSHDDALLVVNFANADMVGHTGVLEAAIQAVEVVDECVGRVVDAILGKGGAAIITADHGNCEMMLDPETGRIHTAHTTLPVHAVVCDPRLEGRTPRTGAMLADIAPTALSLMGVAIPPEMTGTPIVGPV